MEEKEQTIQEEQYDLPYHYFPRVLNGGFSQAVYWSWGFRYLGGLRVAEELCNQESWESLLDIGCGDGRFMAEMARAHPNQELVGIDYSNRAISLAKAMNPDLDFRVCNILKENFDAGLFDVVTLVEVIEHIPPAELEAFIERAVAKIKPGGRLILTVPHCNKTLNIKHFQHFNSAGLSKLMEPHFGELSFQPFDFSSILLKLWFMGLGNSGKYFVVTWPALLERFYRYYLEHCLYGNDETKCGRIACVGSKPH